MTDFDSNFDMIVGEYARAEIDQLRRQLDAWPHQHDPIEFVFRHGASIMMSRDQAQAALDAAEARYS
jgi:hypothetical protein